MAYCAPKGIPYSVFCGWTQQDREAALAWERREASACRSCGQYRDQLVDKDGIRKKVLPVVAVDWRCPGCAAAETHDKRRGDRERPPGESTVLVPTQWVHDMEAASLQREAEAGILP